MAATPAPPVEKQRAPGKSSEACLVEGGQGLEVRGSIAMFAHLVQGGLLCFSTFHKPGNP